MYSLYVYVCIWVLGGTFQEPFKLAVNDLYKGSKYRGLSMHRN